jgi:hypothetical protein
MIESMGYFGIILIFLTASNLTIKIRRFYYENQRSKTSSKDRNR